MRYEPDDDADDDINKNVSKELLEKRTQLSKELTEISRPLRLQLSQVEQEIRQARLAGLTEEPKCPECCASPFRQKCMWEIGGCPRRDAFIPYGTEKEVAAHFEMIKAHKPKDIVE